MPSNKPIAVPDRPAGRDWWSRETAGLDWWSREMSSMRLREKRAQYDAAWERTIREGLPFSSPRSSAPPTLETEAGLWVDMFGRLGCRLDISPHSRTLGYIIPPAAQEDGEAFQLIQWLAAAERRVPGITERVIQIAFNYDALLRVLATVRQAA